MDDLTFRKQFKLISCANEGPVILLMVKPRSEGKWTTQVILTYRQHHSPWLNRQVLSNGSISSLPHTIITTSAHLAASSCSNRPSPPGATKWNLMDLELAFSPTFWYVEASTSGNFYLNQTVTGENTQVHTFGNLTKKLGRTLTNWGSKLVNLI